MAAPFVLEGDDLIRVVGTSHYQEALARLSGRRADEEVRVQKIAVLVPEPENPYDPDAIAIQIEGALVGYLSRDENKRWRDVVAGDAPVAAEAMIAGRAGIDVMGVFLRLPTPTEARAQIGIRRGR